jgi:hypothetical protein
MEYSFSHYLLAKQSVDDRALNRHVYDALKSALSATSVSPIRPLSTSVSPNHPLSNPLFPSVSPIHPLSAPLQIVEVGAGIGTMLIRLLRWGLLQQADYTLVDELPENIDYAAAWIPSWAAEHGLRVEKSALNHFRVCDNDLDVRIHLERADVFDFVERKPEKSDLLIAHAFLDLLPMPESLDKLFSLLKPKGLAWLTLNFDGVTTLEPPICLPASVSPFPPLSPSVSPTCPAPLSGVHPLPASVSPFHPLSTSVDLDSKIEYLYHHSMDTRPTGGDSRSGRRLFGHLRSAGAEILAAGASDWVVHATDGKYPADEAYFLHFILHFFEETLGSHPELDAEIFQAWLAERRRQIDYGELVYIAHQIDFLAQLS